MVDMLTDRQWGNQYVIKYEASCQNGSNVGIQAPVEGMEGNEDFIRIQRFSIRRPTVNTIGQAEMEKLRSNDGRGRLVFFAPDGYQFMHIRDAPIDMAAQGQRRKRASRRVPGKNRPDLGLEALAGLLEDQAAAGKNGIVKMGRKIDPTHIFRGGRIQSAPTIHLR